jgi:formiminoglutamase
LRRNERSRTFRFHDIDDRSKLSQLVEKIDKDVSHIIFNIKSGKTHNNMVVTIIYGNIKGTVQKENQ